MNTLITGGHGFLGWHLACRLKALHGEEPTRLGRDDFASDRLERAVASAEVIYHLAGVNRADTDGAVESGNVELARSLAEIVRRVGRPLRVVNANSIQADLDNAYGRGKARAAEILQEAVGLTGGSFVDVMLPNLFGEHGRPHYNSFVATFCSMVAEGERPTVVGDKRIPLLHAQRAAQALIDATVAEGDQPRHPDAEWHLVSDVLAKIQSFDRLYRKGEIPNVNASFDLDLFNTYRSYTFPQRACIRPLVHEDERGTLFETLRSHGGTGQTYASTTLPGKTRGEHYHLRKIERFAVVRGDAEIGFRRLFDREVLRIRVSGDTPTIVDMPTMWVHNLRNVGDGDLITVFWSDQLLDSDQPDQFYEPVDVQGATR